MQRRVSGGGFEYSIVSECEGEILCEVLGEGAWELFRHESGGHRWQRIPPTETKGRRHSSTFTVAVFRSEKTRAEVKESDIRFEATIGHGPGGQHRNKTATAIRAVHCPTGITASIQSERSQLANKQRAIEVIRSRVAASLHDQAHSAENGNRKQQIGTGERSDKIRTVQEQNDRVVDHRTGRKCNLAKYLKGEIWRLA